jgi:hypothetical protein
METNDMSENQRQFIADAESQGYEWVYYSGRGMFGRQCPSVHVEDPSDLETTAKHRTDSLGLGYVLYAVS